MKDLGIIGWALIAVNIIFSYKGFTNNQFFEGYKFEVDRILINKDYKRLITSGFLHVNRMHLFFNMLSLYAFSSIIEIRVGGLKYLLIYFSSLIGGNLFSLFVHRNHSDYSAVGASGAVSGIIFAALALFPGMGVSFFGIPFSIQGWLYGLLFVLYSIYGIRSSKDNIGHEAHLGGALIGLATALLLEPSAFTENYITILVITIPSVAFIFLIITRPYILLVDNLFFKSHKNFYSVDHKYNTDKSNQQKEIDKILDKISSNGMAGLSKKEKQLLKEYSKNT